MPSSSTVGKGIKLGEVIVCLLLPFTFSHVLSFSLSSARSLVSESGREGASSPVELKRARLTEVGRGAAFSLDLSSLAEACLGVQGRTRV